MTTPPQHASSTKHFIRHYAEMVVAMFLGMVILGVPAGWALAAAGTSTSALTEDAPALMLLGMAVTMTVPMVGWMAYRGHGRRANAEMAASMFLPTFAAMGLLAAGMITDFGALLIIEHVAMLMSMLAAMLLRPDEYRSHPHHTDAHADEDLGDVRGDDATLLAPASATA
jgi:hypothetical protein